MRFSIILLSSLFLTLPSWAGSQKGKSIEDCQLKTSIGMFGRPDKKVHVRDILFGQPNAVTSGQQEAIK